MGGLEAIIEKQLKVLKNRNHTDWDGSKYEIVKRSNLTAKGDFGEEVATDLFSNMGFPSKIVNCQK